MARTHGRRARSLDGLRSRRGAALHTARCPGGDLRRAARCSRRVSVYARDLSGDVQRASLDDAPLLGLGRPRGHQRALSLPPEPGADRALGRARSPNPDGDGLRPQAGGGRGRQGRRRDRLAGRHGGDLRRHPARPGLDLVHDQRDRPNPLGHVPGGRRAPGSRPCRAPRHGAERHPQGVPGAEDLLYPPGRRSGSSPT